MLRLECTWRIPHACRCSDPLSYTPKADSPIPGMPEPVEELEPNEVNLPRPPSFRSAAGGGAGNEQLDKCDLLTLSV